MAGAPPDWSLPLLAAGARVRRQAALEWHGSAAAEALRRRLAASGLAGAPRSFRPTDPERGEDLLEGRWMLAGAVLESGLTGDPWDQASPTKRFAEALHRFGWLRDLLATGEPGAAEGARLFEGWERAFGRWSAFSWSGPIMGRRVMELACGARRLTGAMDEAGRRAFLASLLRQADALSAEDGEPAGAAERAAAAAVAASALDGEPAARVAARAVGRLERALDATVLPDGGHRSRSPEAALELLLDLQTLDDLLLQRGREAPKRWRERSIGWARRCASSPWATDDWLCSTAARPGRARRWRPPRRRRTRRCGPGRSASRRTAATSACRARGCS
jgi:uncharacterized heparinase superfamily protein